MSGRRRRGATTRCSTPRAAACFVGQVMTVEPLRPEVKRWWEGDLRMYVDGRRHPALQGTGHEDEYLGGWSNEWLMNPYTLPMHGEPKTAELTQVDFQWNAATTVYRFFAAGVPFQSRLIVSTEHGVDNAVPAMYSSVAYYYQRADVMTLADTLDVGEAQDETAHRYEAMPPAAVRSLTSRFEAMYGTSDVTDRGRDVTGRSRFRLTAPADHGGIAAAPPLRPGARAGRRGLRRRTARRPLVHRRHRCHPALGRQRLHPARRPRSRPHGARHRGARHRRLVDRVQVRIVGEPIRAFCGCHVGQLFRAASSS